MAASRIPFNCSAKSYSVVLKFTKMAKRAAERSTLETPSKKRIQYFRKEYTEEFYFIRQGKLSETNVCCEICHCEFSIKHGGKNDITRHIAGLKHTELFKKEHGAQKLKEILLSAKKINVQTLETGQTKTEPHAHPQSISSHSEPVWLYAHPSMETLAKEIVDKCNHPYTHNQLIDRCSQQHSHINLLTVFKEDSNTMHRSLSRCALVKSASKRDVLYRDTISWDKFPDGFPNLFIQDVHSMAGKDGILLDRLTLFCHIFQLAQWNVWTLKDKSLQLRRVFFLSATDKTLAIMMSTIPLTARGPVQICIFDIHALQERFYFSDNVIPRLESAVPLLISTLQDLPDRNNIVIAFPDDGAFKRFHLFFHEYDTIICVKIRDNGERYVKIKDGNPKDKHVVIVDDLVQTGGTLKECLKALVNMGAMCVSAYVTHPVFPKDSWKKFANGNTMFRNFWITDSLPHATEIAKHEPFRLLSLCNPIANMLMGYDLQQ